MGPTQLKLFDPGAHVHTWTKHKGPVQTQPEITLPSGNRWCWTCHEWVTVHPDGAMDTYSERTDYTRELVRKVADNRLTRTLAIDAYRKRFQTSYGTAQWEVDWAIGYYNKNGDV